MTVLRLRAPAKINWTLEVLGKRPDGYHEVRTLLQTIDLCDTITLHPAPDLSLTLEGDAGSLAHEPPESNLAYRAAALLRDCAGARPGAHITIEKRIPIAAGLGGGSSDAAAVLRGLRSLWQLDLSDDDLMSIGADIGSDVPFFVGGGTALASGRGEVIESLPDPAEQRIQVSSPPPRVAVDKTARMYAALRPAHYTDGSRTAQLAERLRAGRPVRDEDCFNVFELVLPEVDPEATARFEGARQQGLWPHLFGSGPAFFTLNSAGVRTLSAGEATRIEELS